MTTKIYIVELHGSTTATCPELNLEYTSKKHGVIDPLARLMLDAGADPEGRIHVIRGSTPVFARDRKVSTWAGERLLEPDTRGFRKGRFKEDSRTFPRKTSE